MSRGIQQKSPARSMGSFILMVLFSTFFAMALIHFSPLRLLENMTYDWRVANFAPAPANDIVIVGIDDRTYQAIKAETTACYCRVPLGKQFLTRMLKQIDSGNPRIIAFDILLDDWSNEAEFDEFRSAVESNKSRLVATTLSTPLSPQEKNLADAGLHFSAPLQQIDDVDNIIRYANVHLGSRMSFAGVIANNLGFTIPKSTRPITYFQDGEVLGGSFINISAADVSKLPSTFFTDKIILIGLHPNPLEVISEEKFHVKIDRHMTPLRFLPYQTGDISGVELHAHVLATYLTKKYISFPPTIVLYLMFFLPAGAGLVGARYMSNVWIIGLALAQALSMLLFGVIAYNSMLLITPIFGPIIAFLIGVLAGYQNRVLIQTRNVTFLNKAFRSYISPSIIKLLMRNSKRLSVHAERTELTYLVTDLEEFSAIVDALEPDALQALINAYFDSIITVLWRHGATIDKVVGDGVYAMFGAPIYSLSHANDAIACAYELDREAEKFRIIASKKFGVSLGQTRIGLATGEVKVGNFGSEKHLSFTAYGQPVVLAARLQEAAKHNSSRVIISVGSALAAKSDASLNIIEVSVKDFPSITTAYSF